MQLLCRYALAARELKRANWRFHKKYATWFARQEEPKVGGGLSHSCVGIQLALGSSKALHIQLQPHPGARKRYGFTTWPWSSKAPWFHNLTLSLKPPGFTTLVKA
jgi:hypothetical protein